MIYERIAARSERLSDVARPLIRRIAGFSDAALYRATLARLDREFEKNGSVEDLLDIIYSSLGAFLTIRPIQVKEEISQLLTRLEKVKPKTVVEIGTANGGTLFLLSRVADPNATLVSIDKPNGSFGGGYARSMMPVFRSFAREKQQIILVRGDSHERDTFEQTRKILDSKNLDFLFIDGDHSYRGVKSDFTMYTPLVSQGGIVALHDIVPGLSSHVGEVPRFWGEVRQGYRSREIVKNWDQGEAGIGLLDF